MKTTLEMPAVLTCSAVDCAYNLDQACHAKAITIGDGLHPGCDTFMDDSAGQTHRQDSAGVGACKVTACSFNDDLECTAEHIEVAMQEGSADCATCCL